MDLAKLQNGSDVRGVALAGVEGESVTLDDAAGRAIAGGFARCLRARLGKERFCKRIAVVLRLKSIITHRKVFPDFFVASLSM